MSSGVSNQARHKPACTATEAGLSLEISAIESRDIILSKQQTTKVLIRLRGCAGWSAPLLFGYDLTHFLMARLIFMLCLFSKIRETRAVRGSNYSPTTVLSEEKDKLVTENWRDRDKKISKDSTKTTRTSSFHAEHICKFSKQLVENFKRSCAHKVPTVYTLW